MPIHWHPALRSLEDAEATFGINASLDSLGVTELKAAEQAGTVLKVVPIETFYYNKQTYTPHS